MFYLGIDIAKNTHVASLMDEKVKTIFKGFSFSNTTEGGKSLLEIIKKYSEFTNVTVGMEATGHYWLSIYSFLYDYNSMLFMLLILFKLMGGAKELKFVNVKMILLTLF